MESSVNKNPNTQPSGSPPISQTKPVRQVTNFSWEGVAADRAATIARLEAELERVRGAEKLKDREIWVLRDLVWKANNRLRDSKSGLDMIWTDEYARYAESLPALSARQNNDAASAAGGE